MGIGRRRFVKIAGQSAAALALPALKLAAPVVPYVRAVRSWFYPIPVKRLSSEDIEKPGRWRG